MYNSPIDTIVTQIQMQHKAQLENDIFKAVQNVGVNVDKDELLKALQYDRGQYDKGYKDGIEVGIRDFAKFLIDKSENGVICIADMPDLVREMMEGENGN